MKLFFGILLVVLTVSCMSKSEVFDENGELKDSISGMSKESIKPVYVSKNPNASSPFDKIDYDRVVAYDYGREGEHAYLQIVDEKGNLDSTVIRKKDLTQKQTDNLTEYLGKNETYGNIRAYCFEPHMGIVFYKGSKITAHVSICLGCAQLKSSHEIPAAYFKKINAGKEYERPLNGFSSEGMDRLNALCKELQFSHCR